MANEHDASLRHQAPPITSTASWLRADALSMFLLLGFGFLLAYSTYEGLIAIIEESASARAQFLLSAVAAAISAILVAMEVYLLRQVLRRNHSLIVWTFSLSMYALVTLATTGFSFGFYWSIFRSEPESTRSAVEVIGQIKGTLQIESSRHQDVGRTLGTAAGLAAEKAKRELEIGGTCGERSSPGAGARLAMRQNDAALLTSASSEVSRNILGVQTSIQALQNYLDIIAGGIERSGERDSLLKSLRERLNTMTTSYEAFRSSSMLIQFASFFRERAQRTAFESNGLVFKCPDPELSISLAAVAKSIESLPALIPSKLELFEGKSAVQEAFRRLAWSLTKVIPEARPQAARNSESDAAKMSRYVSSEPAPRGLSAQDTLPLFIAVFVNLCIFMVAATRQIPSFLVYSGNGGEPQIVSLGNFWFASVFGKSNSTSVFISYRRSDAEAYAGRVYDHLSKHRRIGPIFMDVEFNVPGINFVKAISAAISKSDFVLVIIGPTWSSVVDDDGLWRVNDPRDFVRVEIASAFEQRRNIIPVLVSGTKMPSSKLLPNDISELANIHAATLDHSHFGRDMERLTDSILIKRRGRLSE
jgi:TIR domain